MIDLVQTAPQRIQDLMRKGRITSAVIGLGYAGLDLAVTMLTVGERVIGFDIDDRKVNIIRRGECPINIPILKMRFEELVRTGRGLVVAKDMAESVNSSEVVFLVVPTPLTIEKRPDLSILRSATRDVGRSLRRGQLVVVESTVYPTTMKKVVLPILEEESRLKAEADFLLAHCPERIDPGNETHRLDNTPRVLAGIGPVSAEVAVSVYGSFIKAPIRKVSTCETAEFTKLLENTYRDVNIALVNEISLLAERLGIDFLEVVAAASTKWSFQPHFPGAGVGGNCIPVIPYYLLESGREHGVELKIVKAARQVNEGMPLHIVDLIRDALAEMGRGIEGSRIALLGISYKAGVDDVRWSPTEKILTALTDMGAIVSCYDPLVSSPPENFGRAFCTSLREALRGADCVVVTTAQYEFKDLNAHAILEMTGSPELAVVDGRNMFSPVNFTRAGIIFRGVGRTTSTILNLTETQSDEKQR